MERPSTPETDSSITTRINLAPAICEGLGIYTHSAKVAGKFHTLNVRETRYRCSYPRPTWRTYKDRTFDIYTPTNILDLSKTYSAS